jgi:hypothetical protein
MRIADLRLKTVLGERGFDARHEIGPIGGIVGVLELASPAFRKQAAGRLLVMCPEGERPVVEDGVSGDGEGHMAPAGGHPVSARCNPDNQFVHKRSSAFGIAATKSSAII